MASRPGPALRSTGFGGVFKSLTKSLKPASGNVPVVINAKVVGGGNDMQRLLLQLQHGPLPSRASAAQEVTGQLEKYSILSIPEVWYLARDLCDYKVQSSIRRVVLKLMIQCIKQDENAVSNRLMYFKDITLYCQVNDSRLDPEFDLFLKALRSLTADGKDIHDFYMYDHEHSLGSFIIRCLSVASKRARDFSGDDVPNDKNYDNLVHLIWYLTNCFKYNFDLIDEQMVTSALSLILQASSQTDHTEITSSCIDFVRVCALYGYVPEELLDNTAQFLCWSSMLSDEMSALSCDAMKTMYLENSSGVLTAACNVLHNPALLQQQNIESSLIGEKLVFKTYNSPTAIAIGAMSMLEQLYICILTDKKNLDLNREELLRDLNKCLDMGVPLVNSGLLRMFDRLFGRILAQGTKFSVLFPFQSWYSSTLSMFQLLSSFKINSDQDGSYWMSICASLFKQYRLNEIVAPKERLVHAFMEHPHYIPEDIVEFVLKYYTEEQSCTVLDPLWKENCTTLLNSFYFTGESTRVSSQTRIKCLQTIKSGFEVSMSVYDDYNVSKEILLEVILKSVSESDPVVVEYVMDEFVALFIEKCSTAFVDAILLAYTPLFQVKIRRERIKSIVSLGSFGSGPQMPRQGSVNSTTDMHDLSPKVSSHYLKKLAESLSRSLLAVYAKNATKADALYDFIIEMVQFCLKSEQFETVAIFLKLLVRLRSTSEGFIYFTDPKEVDGIATTFRRNKLAKNFEATNSWWEFPEYLPYLPSEYYDHPNRNWIVASSESTKVHIEGKKDFRITSWFNVVLNILEEYYHWELYSYTWAHFCSQLSNMSLFDGHGSQIQRLQKIVCEQLTLNLPRQLTASKTIPVTKADMQVAYIRTMSSLIGYHEHFRKADEDQIVSSLLFGLDSWEKTAIPSIHMLNVCCFEIPMSLKKYLTAILTRMQTGVTSAFASPPTMEFLMSLIQVPILTSNFTTDEFKRVFAIAFKYIQYASDLKFRKVNNSTEQGSLVLGHGVDAEVDTQASTQATEITPILNEYLLTVSYLVISRWFLKINMTDRRQVSGFLIKNIVLCNGDTESATLDERAVAFLDLIARFTYCDIPLHITTMPKLAPLNSHTMCSRWIVGHSIVSIETETLTGKSVFCLRRPTGSSIFQVSLDPAMLPPNMENNSHPKVLNGYFLLQLLRPLDPMNRTKPVALFDDTATERALSSFDRIPVVSHHKAGILYIGPGQKIEAEILGNEVGSEAYHTFLDGIGRLVRLKDCTSTYVGGLDKENGTDGDFAYVWNDHLSLLVYHTTTLMPNLAADKYFAMKKRHIGNNHINVFFDESGHPFNFNVIKSQFNFINIVISPHSVQGTVSGIQSTKFYKVKAYRRSGVPGIFSSTHFKLISLDQLLDYVRNMVLMADRFAHIWHYASYGNYTTNWALRVKHIRTLRDKTEEMHRNLQHEKLEVKTTVPSEGTGVDMTQSFLEQLQATSIPTAIAPSKYEYVTPGDNELYLLLEFNSYT